MPLETWVSIGTLLIAMLALATFLRSTMIGVETRLVERIDSGDAHLGERIDALDSKIDTVNANLSKRIDALDSKIDTVETSLGKRIDAVEANLGKRIDTLDTSLTGRIEKLDDRVYALAVGIKPLLKSAEEKSARTTRRPA